MKINTWSSDKSLIWEYHTREAMDYGGAVNLFVIWKRVTRSEFAERCAGDIEESNLDRSSKGSNLKRAMKLLPPGRQVMSQVSWL